METKERKMSNAEMLGKPSSPEMDKRHAEAEELVLPFSYSKPDGVSSGKGRVQLVKTDRLNGVVQIVKKNGGENNLHYHTNSDSMWMVIRGRVRFYGPGDEVIGEFGPNEGTVTPAYSRYWFENVGEGELELLQVSAYHDRKTKGSGRTDVTPQRYKVGTSDRYSAVKS
jgi:mannose-6-phosphate isomerase-like protein (cupin superfamily)